MIDNKESKKRMLPKVRLPSVKITAVSWKIQLEIFLVKGYFEN